MQKTRIHFDVIDNEYFDKLKSYILLNCHNLLECTDKNYDYIVTDKEGKKEKHIIISDYQFDVYKYQKASKICSSLINLTKLTKEENSYVTSEQHVKIISITATRGGSGKTKVAQEMASFLASTQKKVLYLLLDSFSPMDGIFEDQHENDLSKLIYYCQCNKEVNKSIEAVKSFDHQKQVYFLRSLYPSLDGFMPKEVAEEIIKSLHNNQVYDYIILDIPTYLTEGHLVLLTHSTNSIVINNLNEKRDKIFIKFLNQKMDKPCNEIKSKQKLDEIITVIS